MFKFGTRTDYDIDDVHKIECTCHCNDQKLRSSLSEVIIGSMKLDRYFVQPYGLESLFCKRPSGITGFQRYDIFRSIYDTFGGFNVIYIVLYLSRKRVPMQISFRSYRTTRFFQ